MTGPPPPAGPMLTGAALIGQLKARIDRLVDIDPIHLRDVLYAVLDIPTRTIPHFSDDTTMTRVAGYNEHHADVIHAVRTALNRP